LLGAEEGGSSSSAANDEKQWNMIWKIIAPGKMKIHLWRFAHDCLPTGALMRRNIPTHPDCIFCGREEDVGQAFLQCPFAREVWRLVKATFGLSLFRCDFMSPKLWLFSFLSRATTLEATVLAVGFWYIWDDQNDARNNQSNPEPRQMSHKIIAYAQMITENYFKTKPRYMCESTEHERWTPPLRGEVLINVDAALFSKQRRSSVGAVVHDHDGWCILVVSEPLFG
jgi:hypothetical protein